MSNIIRQTTELALHIVRAYVGPDDTVIDATCGNGHDTLALARMHPAWLFAFDIQEEALASTRKLLAEAGFRDALENGRIRLLQLSHEKMSSCFTSDPGGGHPTEVKAILFNLGYLPGGDKEITTKSESTLAAVKSALDLLAVDGILCITMYSGHPEGKDEKKDLLKLAADLDSKRWHTVYTNMLNQKNDPPEILMITRKK